MEYELEDKETPNLSLSKLEEKIKREQKRKENPKIRPKDVFEGFNETTSVKRKTKTKRLNRQMTI